MYNVKYRHPDNLYEPLLFEVLKKIKVSHTMFKVTSYIEFGPYLKSFSAQERYVHN